MSRSGKPVDASERETLRTLHADNWTDGRIARTLRRCRRTILRQHEAMGLTAVEHPPKRDRLAERTSRAGCIRVVRRPRREGKVAVGRRGRKLVGLIAAEIVAAARAARSPIRPRSLSSGRLAKVVWHP